jgi:hypothetical protein
MKRVIIASILGLASVVSSFAQADYYFDTYLSASSGNDGRVFWTTDASLAPLGAANTAVGNADGFLADLLWNDGTHSGDLGVAIALSSNGSPLLDSFIQGGEFIFDTLYPAQANMTFTIELWKGGASYADTADTARGLVTWADGGTAVGAGPSAFQAAPSGPLFVANVAVIPEPTMMALLGLGAAGLLIIRKRQ